MTLEVTKYFQIHHLILMIILRGKKGNYHHSYFIEEETKAQRLVKSLPKVTQ